ncbi:MAG TPA: HAD family hydrolase, partial [Verrucomicrobiae bacterium]|nr:HAD family hydrolase [Verrucomicrobiae bacterium]
LGLGPVSPLRPESVRALVFDLDGTLYVSRPFSREIFASAQSLVSSRLGLSPQEAGDLIRRTKKEMAPEFGSEVSLTATCTHLGLTPQELHGHMSATVHPENFLEPDPRVRELLTSLSARYRVALYTNNNLSLSGRILERIGCTGIFDTVVSIEDFWHPKPYRAALEKLFRDLGVPPEECLFVGDRTDIDLKLPVEMGAQGWLVRELDDLLALDTLIRRRSGE